MATSRKTHNVYVVALDKAVLSEQRFLAANPEYKPGKPCLYVGMTGLDPDVRFANHKRGYKASKYVEKYGKYLRRKLYEKYNPMTHDQAVEWEQEFARRLRKKGNAVWQK